MPVRGKRGEEGSTLKATVELLGARTRGSWQIQLHRQTKSNMDLCLQLAYQSLLGQPKEGYTVGHSHCLLTYQPTARRPAT